MKRMDNYTQANGWITDEISGLRDLARRQSVAVKMMEDEVQILRDAVLNFGLWYWESREELQPKSFDLYNIYTELARKAKVDGNRK